VSIPTTNPAMRYFRLRTITLGINILDCSDPNWEKMTEKIKDKLESILPVFNEAVETVISHEKEVSNFIDEKFLQTKRITLTPLELVTRAAIRETIKKGGPTLENVESQLLSLTQEIEKTAFKFLGREGVFIGGLSARVEKGITPYGRHFLKAIPRVLTNTNCINSSVNVATTKNGVNMDAVKLMADVVAEIAEIDHKTPPPETSEIAFDRRVDEIRRRHPNANVEKVVSNNAKLAIFANAPIDNPFMAGGYHGSPEAEYTVNVGISGAGVIAKAIKTELERGNKDLGHITKTIKEYAHIMVKAAESIRQRVIRQMLNINDKLPLTIHDGIVDLSIASTDARDEEGNPVDSMARAFEMVGIKVGGPGTLAAVGLIVDSIKKGGVAAAMYHGGLSGAFIPVSEDAGMADAIAFEHLNFELYMAMTGVCSVGIDMIPIEWPEDMTRDEFTRFVGGIIADEMIYGVYNGKITSVRLLPIKTSQNIDPNTWFVFLGGAGLLGASPIPKIRKMREKVPKEWFFKGRIGGPIQSLRD